MVFEAEVHADLNPKVGIWLVWGEIRDVHSIYNKGFVKPIFKEFFHIGEGLR